MPMAKSSRVNQRSRQVVMAEMYRPLPPGAKLAPEAMAWELQHSLRSPRYWACAETRLLTVNDLALCLFLYRFAPVT